MFITGPQDQYVVEYGNGVFQCSAIAKPRHTTTWSLPDGSSVVNSSKYILTTLRQNETALFQQLAVMNIAYEDRGIFTCTVTNQYGHETIKAELIVHGMQLL